MSGCLGLARHSADAGELALDVDLGARVEELPDGLRIDPPPDGPRAGVAIDTYEDHRMAMAFAMVGDVEIRDPDCVAKTFPGYFDELARVSQ